MSITIQPQIQFFPQSILEVIHSAVSITQAPFPLVAHSLLAACSIALQKNYKVQRPDGQITPISLFSIIVAESGERKTTVDSLFTKQFSILEQQKQNEANEQRSRYEYELNLWQIKKKAIESSIKKKVAKGASTEEEERMYADIYSKKPKETQMFKMIYQDVTPEALLNKLYESNKSVALISNEASSIMDGRTMQNLAQLNQLWDGERIIVNRKTKNQDYIIDDARLTIAFMTQPASFKKFVEKNDRESLDVGFIQRCLISYPFSTQGARFDWNKSKEYEWSVIEKFQEYLFNECINEGDFLMTFDDYAVQKYRNEYNNIESCIGPYQRYSQIKGSASKAPNMIARIAAIFAIMSGKDIITVDEVEFAKNIVINNLDEHLRLFGKNGVLDPIQEDVQNLLQWFSSMNNNGFGRVFKRQDVRNRASLRIRKKIVFDDVVGILYANGFILPTTFNNTQYLTLLEKPGVPQQYDSYYDFKYNTFVKFPVLINTENNPSI